MVDKVFVCLVRTRDKGCELLVFRSHDEPGFEVTKGSVEPGESLLNAAFRELFEESGIGSVRVVAELGTTRWGREHQHFFLVETDVSVPETFRHTVTGDGPDCGRSYAFRWLPLSEDLERLLVQGCGAFARALLRTGQRASRSHGSEAEVHRRRRPSS